MTDVTISLVSSAFSVVDLLILCVGNVIMLNPKRNLRLNCARPDLLYFPLPEHTTKWQYDDEDDDDGGRETQRCHMLGRFVFGGGEAKVSHGTASCVWGKREKVSHATASWVCGETDNV